MNTQEMALRLLQRNHEVLAGTMQGVTAEVAHWLPGGSAVPLGALYVHAVTTEDEFFHRVVLGGQRPLFAGEWEGRIGISEPEGKPGTDWGDWARRVRVDLTQAQAYGAAVFAATEGWLAAATPADLDREVAMRTGVGMPLAVFFANVLCNHIANHTGEISTLKGQQGLKGYPF